MGGENSHLTKTLEDTKSLHQKIPKDKDDYFLSLLGDEDQINNKITNLVTT